METLEEAVRRMNDTLVHRGPDGAGVFVAPGIALAHRRLSIIDLSASGAQPMTLGSLTIVYNGETFNFRELRRELESLGSVFQGHSDTEVVLHAYRVWGLAGLSRLEGMFALALWDGATRRLVLMRDRLGIKPLFYGWCERRLAFGSEIKAVRAAGAFGTEIDPQAFAEYLWYGNAFEERTFYREVRALPPGHRLVLDGGVARIESWWRIEQWLQTDAPGSLEEAAGAVRIALDRAVERQLVSDVPVGIFLSGGVDSSAIAAAAAQAGSRLESFA
ncbi:MAG TPA: asparagine synthase (glutamine-hydrolyzing), partial [Steroidobacteraceae bacterium]|nr:asparagine synthase (glutamine-hydrolyzing) [Steroidobacteraceae bacterium]